MKAEVDFFNKLTSEIRNRYFPNESHGTTENQRYHKSTYAIECFNNGTLSYENLVGTLSKNCDESQEVIHSTVSKYIADFEGNTFKPKELI